MYPLVAFELKDAGLLHERNDDLMPNRHGDRTYRQTAQMAEHQDFLLAMAWHHPSHARLQQNQRSNAIREQGHVRLEWSVTRLQ